MKHRSLFYKFALLTTLSLISIAAFAIDKEPSGLLTERTLTPVKPEIVRWIGTVQDDSNSHTTRHDHDLRFTKDGSDDSYDIVDSPALVKLHHDTEKNYKLEIEAQKTPRFLFWGGNLIVKNFRIIQETSAPIPHRKPAQVPFMRVSGRNRH